MAGKLKRDTVLGLVFFSGLLLLIWATFKLANFALFRERPTITVSFPDGRGIKVGDNVLVLGKKMGVVRAIEHDFQNMRYPIRTVLELDDQLTLREGYEIRIQDASLLGGKQVQIRPGPAEGSIVPGSTQLVGLAPPNPIEAIGDLLSGENNKRHLSAILKNVSEIVAEFKEGKGALGQAVTNAGQFFESADEMARSIGDVVADAREGRGNVGEILTKVDDFFASANSIAGKIDTGEGVLARVINDKQLADNVDATIANIETVTRDVRQSKGVLGRLVNDAQWSESVSATLGDVQTAVRSLNDEKEGGTLAALLHDQELKNDVKGAMSDIQDITSDVRAGKGTIGRLFSDDTLIHDVEKLVSQLRRTVEDAREAAPVATFISIFTGAFQ